MPKRRKGEKFLKSFLESVLWDSSRDILWMSGGILPLANTYTVTSQKGSVTMTGTLNQRHLTHIVLQEQLRSRKLIEKLTALGADIRVVEE